MCGTPTSKCTSHLLRDIREYVVVLDCLCYCINDDSFVGVQSDTALGIRDRRFCKKRNKNKKQNEPCSKLSRKAGFQSCEKKHAVHRSMKPDSSPSLPPSESEYESKPLLERSQLMPGCMTYGLR